MENFSAGYLTKLIGENFINENILNNRIDLKSNIIYLYSKLLYIYLYNCFKSHINKIVTNKMARRKKFFEEIIFNNTDNISGLFDKSKILNFINFINSNFAKIDFQENDTDVSGFEAAVERFVGENVGNNSFSTSSSLSKYICKCIFCNKLIDSSEKFVKILSMNSEKIYCIGCVGSLRIKNSSGDKPILRNSVLSLSNEVSTCESCKKSIEGIERIELVNTE